MRTIREYRALAGRALHRGIEAAHVVGWCAIGARSRRNLLVAYAALAKRAWGQKPASARLRWNPTALDARIRVGGSPVSIRFRQADLYVIGEMLHDHPYRVQSVLPPRPVIIDAGANIGLAALWFADRYPGARLYCFEPEPECFTLLKYNLRHLTTATCEPAALGAHTGEIPLYVTESASDHSVFDAGVPARIQSVPCIRLLEYLNCENIERVDLLKLDVEGSELSVLEGLGDHLDRVGVIIGECHERFVDQEAFYKFLQQRGFRVVVRRPVHRLKQDHMFEAAR